MLAILIGVIGGLALLTLVHFEFELGGSKVDRSGRLAILINGIPQRMARDVLLPNYGWVPIDPQAGDKSSSRDRALAIGDLSNRFLITTQGGGDSEYLGWYYNADQSYTCDPKVLVHPDSFAEWEPLEGE